jgi:hypothetical protein
MSNQYGSLEKLKEFIGRKPILNEVPGWLGDGKFHLVFFSGGYGLGKTRLLDRIRELVREQKYPGAPTALIDLYHTHYHYPEGLARAIADCFHDQKKYFQAFYDAQKVLDNARAAGDNKQAAAQLQTMLDACVSGMEKLSKEKGVLLLLDTAERWIYPQGATSTHASAWEWLKTWLGNLHQGAVLLAGRPEIERLAGQITCCSPILIALDKFDLDETKQYLNEIARRYQNDPGNKFYFTDEEVQLLHTLSDGRPILLALYLDLYLLDPQTRDMFQKARAGDFERILIERLISDPNIGEALKAAGRTPKGLDVDLLAAIMGIPREIAAQKMEMLWKLSFAKTFLDYERLFLHDEMYNLLRKIIYTDLADIAEAQQVSEAIENQYRLRIGQTDKKLQGLYEKLVEEFETQKTTGGNIVQAIREIEVPRQALKVEWVYYRLRQNIEHGLCLYYRYAHEAAASGNGEILTPLQIELHEFFRALDLQYDDKDAQSWRPFIQGLLFIHLILQKISDGSAAAQELTDMLVQIEGIPAIVENQSNVLCALLMTWYGASPSLRGQAGDVKKIYSRALELLDVADLSFEKLTWFKNVAESFAYRQRAYVRRTRGDPIDIVIKDYQDALKNSRAIDFWLEESTARNDLGYAQTTKGEFQSARENIEDALLMRYRAAIGARIAQSYSTFAQYDIANQSYEDARKHANYSVTISKSINFLRGEALGHRALAEATRRYGLTVFGLKNKRQFMDDARASAQFAVDAFTKLGEMERIINARLEAACIARDTMLVEDDSDIKHKCFEQADQEFLAVADLAGKEDLLFTQLDALCNRVWLGLYAKDIGFAQAAAERTKQVFPPAYFFKDGLPEDETQAQKNPMVWVILGKLHSGIGMIAFEQWKDFPSKSKDEKAEKSRLMAQVVKNMMLALEYNSLFGRSHRHIRETRQKIWQIVKTLNPEELKIFGNMLLERERTENRSPSELKQFLRDNAFWFADDVSP